MAFRRKNRPTERAKLDATPPWQERVREAPPATTGPFDERDAPKDEVARADLGALQIPLMEGIDLQVEVDQSQQVVTANLVGPQGSMQLGVFAAPRSEGIWDEVRTEIAESLRQQRGTPGERAGGFGTELTGTLPVEGGRVPVRFIGVDGPRWFLRAMLVGPAAVDDDAARPFEDALRQVVVVRGSEPLPVRDPVPLRLPKELLQAGGPAPSPNGHPGDLEQP